MTLNKHILDISTGYTTYLVENTSETPCRCHISIWAAPPLNYLSYLLMFIGPNCELLKGAKNVMSKAGHDESLQKFLLNLLSGILKIVLIMK